MAHDLPPLRAELLEWLGVDPDPGTSPDAYDLCLETALQQQRAACELTDSEGTAIYSESLHYAALRRAALSVAARGMPLGFFDAGDFQTQYLPRWDAEVERAEAAYRRGGFA